MREPHIRSGSEILLFSLAYEGIKWFRGSGHKCPSRNRRSISRNATHIPLFANYPDHGKGKPGFDSFPKIVLEQFTRRIFSGDWCPWGVLLFPSTTHTPGFPALNLAPK